MESPAEGDGALVAASRRGDREAFGRLYRRHAPVVHAVLLVRVPRSDVEDLVQEVFMAALRNLPALRDDGAFGPWLVTIARNRAATLHRRGRPAAPLPEDGGPDGGPGPGPSIEAREALEVLRGLPEAYRETLALRLVEGLSGLEISARTGLTPGSVRVNLHRGMRLLRERLGAP